MTDGITAAEAARRLGTSKPTVRSLIGKGELFATREARGGQFQWRISDESVARYLQANGRVDERRRKYRSRASLESELDELRGRVAVVEKRRTGTTRDDAAERERASLRSEVVNLREALARTRAAAKLQQDADAQRARVIESLVAAVEAAEHADSLRRSALAELEEGLAAFTRPGHIGDGFTEERALQEPH